MKSEWLQGATLRMASFLAPSHQRAEWLEEWRSELWYVPGREATAFCMGAFRDAYWLRRNNLNPVKLSEMSLESPLRCLALLAAPSALSIFLMFRFAPRQGPGPPQGTGGFADLCAGMLMLSCLLLPSVLWLWRPPATRNRLPWPSRLRRGIFLALKLALLLPTIMGGYIVQSFWGPLGGATSVAWDAAVILALRWAFTDQQRRCPVCLRLLSNPIRIGTPSRTLLEWYGTESTCSRGHGLLHVPETSASYSGTQQWLRLDDSWSGLFTGRSRI
jgi:hypothetical protein